MIKKLTLASLLAVAAAGAFAQNPHGLPPAIARKLAHCEDCGYVHSVHQEKREGEGGAVGIIGGAVVGGLLGHQVGGGTGRKIATVVGAVGGGLAGHEIEKRARSTTDYEVRVRMDDGTRRTLYSTQSWAVGERVEVDGNTLQPLGATPPAPPRTQSTSTNGY
jgi:outer membrane lipoprotein SlyB